MGVISFNIAPKSVHSIGHFFNYRCRSSWWKGTVRLVGVAVWQFVAAIGNRQIITNIAVMAIGRDDYVTVNRRLLVATRHCVDE